MSNQKKIHLVTQDNQPFGSTRKSCDLCGAWVLGNSGFKDAYADDRETFKQAVASGDYSRCDSKDGE